MGTEAKIGRRVVEVDEEWTLLFKRIHNNAKLPTYAHETDAGMDLYSVEHVKIMPGERALIHTGLTMALPPLFEAQIRPRSGLALKHGITVLNTPGTIDEGYRGEIGVILFNTDKTEPFVVKVGDKIAQMVIASVVRLQPAEMRKGDELPPSDRGINGFGSTGVHSRESDEEKN